MFIMHDFKLFRIRTYKPELASLKRSDLNSSRMHTYGNVVRNPCGMRTYKKPGGAFLILHYFSLSSSLQNRNQPAFVLLRTLFAKTPGGGGWILHVRKFRSLLGAAR